MGLPEPPSPGSSTPVDDDRRDGLREGAILLGRYRIEREVGQGGMAIVYAASHVTIGAPVAIKVLHAALAQRRPAVDRFLREARAIASVQHPNVVRVSDYGELPDGRPFMVMEYLRGRDLARHLEDASPMSWSAVRPILLQVCAGLQAAHDVGIVHCDVKPQNIFLLDDGGPFARVKVLDFGIAKVSDPSPGDGGARSAEGVLVGTPDYMAPEQSSGAEVDARADIYALGVTLFRTLTGQLPFVSRHWFQTVTQHMYRTPPRPRSLNDAIPEAVETLILRALEKRPDDRFESMRAFADAARSLGEDDASASTTEPTLAADSATGSSMTALSRTQSRSVMIGATVAASLVGALWWGWAQLEAEPTVVPAAAPAEPTEAVRAASVRPVEPAPVLESLIVEAPPPEEEATTDREPQATPRALVPPPPPRTIRKPAPARRRASKATPPRPRIAPAVAEPSMETPEPEVVVHTPPEPAPQRLRIDEVKDPFD